MFPLSAPPTEEKPLPTASRLTPGAGYVNPDIVTAMKETYCNNEAGSLPQSTNQSAPPVQSPGRNNQAGSLPPTTNQNARPIRSLTRPDVVDGGRYTHNCNGASNSLLGSGEGQSNTQESADNEDMTSVFIGDQVPSRSASPDNLDEILNHTKSLLSPGKKIGSGSTSTATQVVSPEHPVSTAATQALPSEPSVLPFKRKALAESESAWAQVPPALRRAELFPGLAKRMKKARGGEKGEGEEKGKGDE